MHLLEAGEGCLQPRQLEAAVHLWCQAASPRLSPGMHPRPASSHCTAMYRSSSSDVYRHEMPGGQYTNLKFQVGVWAVCGWCVCAVSPRARPACVLVCGGGGGGGLMCCCCVWAVWTSLGLKWTFLATHHPLPIPQPPIPTLPSRRPPPWAWARSGSASRRPTLPPTAP